MKYQFLKEALGVHRAKLNMRHIDFVRGKYLHDVKIVWLT